ERAVAGGNARATRDQRDLGSRLAGALELLGNPRRLVGHDDRTGDRVAGICELRPDDAATLVALGRPRIRAGDDVDLGVRRRARLVLMWHVAVAVRVVVRHGLLRKADHDATALDAHLEDRLIVAQARKGDVAAAAQLEGVLVAGAHHRAFLVLHPAAGEKAPRVVAGIVHPGDAAAIARAHHQP